MAFRDLSTCGADVVGRPPGPAATTSGPGRRGVGPARLAGARVRVAQRAVAGPSRHRVLDRPPRGQHPERLRLDGRNSLLLPIQSLV